MDEAGLDERLEGVLDPGYRHPGEFRQRAVSTDDRAPAAPGESHAEREEDEAGSRVQCAILG